MKQAIIGLLVVAVVGGVIYFANTKNVKVPLESSEILRSEESATTSSTSSTISSPPGVPPETTDASIKIVEVEAGSFYYKPNILEVIKGQKVKIVLKSVSLMHDFVIDELGVKMPFIKNGDTGTVEFVADKIGTFEYYCSVGDGKHRANGQVGSITIKE